MSVRRYPLALAAVVTLAACSTDPASPVADDSALRPSAVPSFALAAGQNVAVVTEDDVTRQAENTPPTDNWVLYTRAGTPATAAAFRSGPATPPEGIGSLELATLDGTKKAFLFNYDHVGTPLSTITAISYATYRTDGSLQQVTALNLQVDVNGAAEGGFTTLVFEPVYNTDQGDVVSGAWQDWDAYNGGAGRWWSTRAIPGVCAFDCFVSWADIVAANPNAVITGGFGVNQGSGNPGLTTAIDALKLGYGGNSITYDFEPYRVATSLGDCKNGGWKTVKRPDGSDFRNQGDCVSYVDNL